jgi:hypothetical protein
MSAIKSVVKSVKAVKSVATKKVLVVAIEKTVNEFELFFTITNELLINERSKHQSMTKDFISFNNRHLEFNKKVNSNAINARNYATMISIINDKTVNFSQYYVMNTKATMALFDVCSCITDGVLKGEQNIRVAYVIKKMIDDKIQNVTYENFLKMTWGRTDYSLSKQIVSMLVFCDILQNKDKTSKERMSLKDTQLILGANAHLLANLIKN